jgi:hypothetical protein
VNTLTLIPAAVMFCVTVSAAPIVSVTDGLDRASFVPGQSLTTPSGGPWSNITFNFIDTAGLPTAAGALYLLTQEFLGTPNQLSTGLPGFLATSQSTAGGVYMFAPSLTLAASTQYFVYANASLLLTGAGLGTYTGGELYGSSALDSNFMHLTTQDANFLLAGTPAGFTTVPESGSVVLMGLGLAAFLMSYVRRRYISSSP